MQLVFQDLYAALPGISGAQAVRDALQTRRVVDPAGDLPKCPAPVMLRRRLSPLGRLVLTAVDALQLRDDEPFVVASSWGDAPRSLSLIEGMIETGDVSPAGFTSSVHNANSGAVGLWLKNHAASPAVSAGNFTTEAGLVECRLQLATHPSVVFIRAETPLPAPWNASPHLRHAPAWPYVWAMRLTLQGPGTRLELVPDAAVGENAGEDDRMDDRMDDLRLMLGLRSTLRRVDNERCWRWTLL